MRKLTIEVALNENIREAVRPMLRDVHCYEILETLKIDREKGICVDLIECELEEGRSINDLKTMGHYEILSVLKSEGNKHTCLARYNELEDSKELFREFDLDLIYTPPTKISEKRFTLSCIGDNDNLKRFIELIRTHAGKIESMSFKRAAYRRHDILSVLTDKQREILVTAHKHGYYKYPRKIKTQELANKIGISKGTAVEHLRKAEERIMENILAGH